jgi:hypothetical protein
MAAATVGPAQQSADANAAAIAPPAEAKNRPVTFMIARIPP